MLAFYLTKGDFTMIKRRKDSKNRVLKTGESERKTGGYQYRWETGDGKIGRAHV